METGACQNSEKFVVKKEEEEEEEEEKEEEKEGEDKIGRRSNSTNKPTLLGKNL